MRTLRMISAVAVSAILVGGLTACNSKSGGSGDAAGSGGAAAAGKEPKDPKQALLASAAVMDKAGSAKIAMTITGSAAGSGAGVMSWKAPQGMELTMNQAGQDVKVEMIDGLVYSSIPAAQAGALGGKKWMKIDPKAASAGGKSGQADGFASMQQMLSPGVGRSHGQGRKRQAHHDRSHR